MAKRKNVLISENEPVIIPKESIIPDEEVKKLKENEIAEVTAPNVKIIDDKPNKIFKSKFKLGDIVFITKDTEADLNGFKLFPQYKKYTYTVEDYDEISGVYSLRRLNLLLKLKEDCIVAPNERAHDSLNRKQY